MRAGGGGGATMTTGASGRGGGAMVTVWASPAPRVASRTMGSAPGARTSTVTRPGVTATAKPSRSVPSGAPLSRTWVPTTKSVMTTVTLPTRRSSMASSVAAASRVGTYRASCSARAVASRLVAAISS